MSLPAIISAQLEEQNFHETGLGLGDKIFYGGAATVYSAVNSLYNTAATYGQWLGLGTEKEDTADWLRNTIGDDASKYYQDNQSTFDTAGFILGSVGIGIGTTALVKAMQLGKLGANAQRFTGIFSTPKTAILKEAELEYKKGALAVSAQLSAAKNKAFALGVADQAYQSLFVETAIAATMNQSPFLQDWEVGDYISNAAVGIGLGAAFGGIFELASTNKFFKEVQLSRSKAVRPYESKPGIGSGDYTKGDQISFLVNELDKLPAVPTDIFEKAASAVKDKTIVSGWDRVRATANEMAGGNPLMGKAVVDSLQKARANGAGIQELTDLLSNAQLIKPITFEDEFEKSLVYFKQVDSSKLAGNQPTFFDFASESPIPGQKLNLPYEIKRGYTPKVEFLPTSKSFKTVQQAYNSGIDIVIDAGGIPHINPRTKNIQRAPMPGEATTFSKAIEQQRAKTGVLPADVVSKQLRLADVIIDLDSGEITETALATAGDIFASSKSSGEVLKLVNKNKELYYGVGKKVASESEPGLWGGDILKAAEADKKATYEALGESWFKSHSRWLFSQLSKTAPNSTVNAADIPLLVRAIRTAKEFEGVSANPSVGIDFLRTLKITSVEGNPIALSKIKYMEQLTDELEKATKGYVDSLLAADVPADYISRIMNYSKKDIEAMDFSREAIVRNYLENPIDVTKPAHAKIQYKVGNPVDENTGMLLRGLAGLQEKIKLQREVNDSAFASYAGSLSDKFVPLDSAYVRKNADPLGISADMIKTTQGDYSLKGIASYIGSLTDKLTKGIAKSKTEQLAYGGGQAILNNEKGAAEVALLLHATQRTGRKYVQFNYFDPVTKTNKFGYIEETLKKNLDEILATPNRDFIKSPFMMSELEAGQVFKQLQKEGFSSVATEEGLRPWIFIETAEGEQLAKTFHNITRYVADTENSFRQAQGLPPVLNGNHLYAPPADLKKYPYLALIRNKQGGLGKTDTVGAITARTEQDFRAKIGKVDTSKYQIITDKTSKEYHKALGDFEYNRMIHDPDTDSFIKREGLQAEFYPNLSPAELVARMQDYIQKQVTVQTRNFVGLKYAQEFEELQALSSQHLELATSRVQRVSRNAELAVKDPYMQYIKTMLNMSSINEHPLWISANEKANALLGPAFNAAKNFFFSAANKTIGFDEANALAEKAGLGSIYKKVAEGINLEAEFKAANGIRYDPQIVSRFISTVNNIVVNLALRLDHANSLINSISMPILMVPEVRSILKNSKDPTVTGQLGEALSWKIANTSGMKMPSATKLYFNAIERLHKDPALRQYYQDINIVKPNIKDYYNLVDSLSITGSESMGKLTELTNTAVDKASKLFLSDAAEQWNRMISADVMKQITEIAGIEPRLAAAYIHTFSARVNGTIIASQRPVLFQGPVGQALGLFQSYQFNLMQNLFRHIETDKKAAAMLLGIQSSIFGAQSLPAFHAINTHLVGNASGNKEHSDIFSYIPRALPNELAETLLYGGVGWFTDTALYTRGDINPRNITVVPVNPMDWPAVSAFGKMASNLLTLGENIAKGAGIGTSLLFALEHNGISRPMSGLAQLAQGYSTTSKGGLIAAQNDLMSIATMSRAIGSKPLSEAIAMDANYRMVSYRAQDKELRTELSRAIRTKLMSGQEVTSEDWESFSTEYARSGGTMQGYQRFVTNIMKTYNEPVANKALANMNTSYNRRMWEIMGGEGLDEIIDSEAIATSQ